MILRRLLIATIFLASETWSQAQQINPVPDYVFRNQMSVGRNAVTDTGAYFSIGPRYGAVKGFMPPIVSDTASVNANKRNGLLIFSVQKNKFLYWDSVRVQWSDMAGSSGSYITGKGITGYVPQYTDTATLDTSALYTLGNQLGIGTSSFAYSGSGRTVVELNGTAGGLYGFKRNDSAKGYLFHNGDNMELANTVAGSIYFNTNSATRGSIASDGVWRLHNLAGTGDRVVVASSNGTLSAASSATGLVDTLTISTRAWRQKGLDSLAALEVSGSGTTNYVSKFTAGSTIGNSQIFDNGTNVGIGTASPTTPLTVLGRGTFTDANGGVIIGQYASVPGFGGIYSTQVTPSGSNYNFLVSGTNTYISSPNGFIRFDNAGTERLRITSGGDVGIGTSSPALKLHVVGDIGTTTRVATDLINGWTGGSTPLTIQTGGAQNLILGTNATERLRIFANGRIGVNTTTDAGYQLDVNGTLRSVNGANFATTSGNVLIGTATASSISTARLSILGSGVQDSYVQVMNGAGGGFLMGSLNGTGMQFYTLTGTQGSESGTKRMEINSNGEVLVNPGSDAGDYKLQVSGNIYNTGSAVLAATSGNVGVGTASPNARLTVGTASGTLGIPTTASFYGTNTLSSSIGTVGIFSTESAAAGVGPVLTFGGQTGNAATPYPFAFIQGSKVSATAGNYAGQLDFFTVPADGGVPVRRLRISGDGELLINTTTDAGDYKLQVVGNARIGTGKLDIASNTTFGIGVARSGTSQVAGQIYNSNGILYLGAESSAGGQIFTGSSAYAAVIGSGANYPLQFATNNATRATINTNGELLINTTSDAGDFKLQVNGNGLISGSIKTANGGSSTAVPWHLGSVVATSVQLDTANYVEVEINGTFYRLAIVTPL